MWGPSTNNVGEQLTFGVSTMSVLHNQNYKKKRKKRDKQHEEEEEGEGEHETFFV